jgi:hypothetical protein
MISHETAANDSDTQNVHVRIEGKNEWHCQTKSSFRSKISSFFISPLIRRIYVSASMPWIIFRRERINNAAWFALKSFHSVYGSEKRNFDQSLNTGLVDFDRQPQIMDWQ